MGKKNASPGPAVEPCAAGELRLTRDAKGRLVKAEFFDGRKRVGPTLSLDPGEHSGRYFKEGDSHDFTYDGGRSYMHTAWDDEAQDGYAEPFDEWVEHCLEDLRSRGLSLLWKAGEESLKAGRFAEAAKAFATLHERWGIKPTVWSSPGDERNKSNRDTLAFLKAVASGDPAMDNDWDAWCRGNRDVKDVARLLEITGKALGIDGVARLRSAWVKYELSRAVKAAGSDDKKLQSGLDLMFGDLERLEGGRQAFADELIAEAQRTPRLASWAGYFGVKAAGKTTEKTRKLLEKKSKGGETEIADLNNLALHQINDNQLDDAHATLDRVGAILKKRPPLKPGAGMKKGDAGTLKRLEDEYFYSVHRASLLWKEKKFPEAWPFARRARELEDANREAASFTDPFDNSTRYGVARSGGSWAHLSVLTGLGKYTEADDAFRKILDDEPVMAARLRLDPMSAEYMLIGGLSNYLESQDAGIFARAATPYAHVQKLVPEPKIANLTYTYACLEARCGNAAAALTLLGRSLKQGFSKDHARSDPDFTGLASNPELLKLTGGGKKPQGK